MRLFSNVVKFNPYLVRLTKGEPNLNWVSILTRYWFFLWIGSCFLTRLSMDTLTFMTLQSTYQLGLPISILVIVVLLVLFIFMGSQLAATEKQSEQLTLLRLTNVSHSTIFWSLILANIYRARYWLAWVIGGSPFFIWIICQWYISWMPICPSRPGDCYLTLLGNRYFYFDGPSDPHRYIELFWFVSITVCILGIGFLANAWSVGFAIKSENILLSTAGVLGFIAPLVVIVVLLVAPEGFLSIDSAYWQKQATFTKMLATGISAAILQFIVLLGPGGFLLRWAFN